MRIGLKLLAEDNSEQTYSWSIFNIMKMIQCNKSDPDKGTYVWDIQGTRYVSPTPIYDIEIAIQKVEDEQLYAVSVFVANNISKEAKKKATTQRKRIVKK